MLRKQPLGTPKRLLIHLFHDHSTLLAWVFVLGVGLLATWQFHIAQFSSHFDIFPGDRGDARLVAYLMEHWYQVFRGTESWLSPAVFYPVQGTLGYADLLLGYSVVFSGLRTLGLGIFEAAEFTIILFNFLNFLICFVLLKVLRFNVFASCAGAVFFAFNSPKLVQIGHLQLQPILFLPLSLIGIILLIQRHATLSQGKAFGLLALATLSLNLQLLTGFYPGWFFVFWSFLFLLMVFLFKRTRSFVMTQLTRFWPALAATSVVFIVGLVPLLMAYLPILRSMGGRPYAEALKLIPVPWSLLVMGERNRFWGTLSATIKASHPLHPELQIGIGLVPSVVWLGITVFGVWLIIKNSKTTDNSKGLERRTELLFLAQLIVTTSLVYLLGMRYWQGYSPWQLVYYSFPGAQAIRAVARYVMVLALPMAIAFAFVIHEVTDRISRQKNGVRRALSFLGLFLVVAFGLVEQFARMEGFNGFSISAENVYLKRVAETLPDSCSSFYVAVGPAGVHNQFEYQVDAALVSIIRHVPTLNGYSGQLPPNWGLFEIKDPGYEDNVKGWIDQNQLRGTICRLVIKETTAPNDIYDPGFFVRQQYRDILGREPDPAGFQQWLTKLNGCKSKGLGAEPNCDRVNVSMGILESEEFLRGSYFVFRLYLSTLGRMPSYMEFLADRKSIVESTTPAQQESTKEALVNEWVQRPEFKAIYGGLTNASYVEKLLKTAGVVSPDQNALVSELEGHQKSRAQVLQTVVDDQQTFHRFHDRAFVVMQFFANLNRDPQPWEYEERVGRLGAAADYRQLVFDFIYSVEYRKRFGYVN